MFQDMAGDGGGMARNAVWDGQTIQLFGGRGEYVSYQLVVNRTDLTQPLRNVKVSLDSLSGPAGVIGGGEIELFKNWYARNKNGQWQPAYCIPWETGRAFEVPDPQRGIASQGNQSMYVDVYIPKRAKAGTYQGTATVESGSDRVTLPIQLQVYDFDLPDTLSFLPELNAYRVPRDSLAYHRLAHQHRLAFNPWAVRPQLNGAGKDIQVQWEQVRPGGESPSDGRSLHGESAGGCSDSGHVPPLR